MAARCLRFWSLLGIAVTLGVAYLLRSIVLWDERVPLRVRLDAIVIDHVLPKVCLNSTCWHEVMHSMHRSIVGKEVVSIKCVPILMKLHILQRLERATFFNYLVDITNAHIVTIKVHATLYFIWVAGI